MASTDTTTASLTATLGTDTATTTTTTLGSSSMESNVVFPMIDDLVNSHKLTAEEATEIKARIGKLFDAQQIVQEREKGLMKRVRALNNEVLKERIGLQEAKIAETEHSAQMERLETERAFLQQEYDDVEAKDSMLKYQLSEIQQIHEELEGQMQDMKLANENLVYPELQKLKDSMANMDKELRRNADETERDGQTKKRLIKIYEDLQEEVEKVQQRQEELRDVYRSIEGDPSRIKKQIDVVAKAKSSMEEDLKKIKEKITLCQASIDIQLKKKAEAEEVKKNLVHKLELHRETIDSRQVDLNNIKRSLEAEQDKNHQLITKKMEIDLTKRQADEELRHSIDALSTSKKEYDMLKRKLRGKRGMADAAREVLPGLEQTLLDEEHVLKAATEDCRKNAKEILELKAEVDVYIAKYLKQEGVEKEAADRLQSVMGKMEALEEEFAHWVAEERKQNRLIAILSAHREMKVREAARAKRNEKETTAQVKMKELLILENTKKCTEFNNRLKEFSALYDIVKNERNKYVNLIQVSNQALAEMKEKIKILQNEIEILRNECKVKDRELAKEVAAHQAAQVQRDALRYDTNKSQAEYKKKQEIVDQHIVEIDKLNSLINQLEKKMLSLKVRYERAVESRNLAGVQLIDRNDELCILYEKSNIQEQTLKQGEVALQKREEDLRLMRLQVAEMERVVEAAKKHIPQTKIYANKVSKLQEELAMEKTLTDQLCKDLEDPRNTDRWKALPGDNPNPEQLATKIEVLEERLNQKKEQLLEKELMLEEVTNLTVKLRNQAASKRDDTIKLAKRASDFQYRIRDTARKMMALVAELSMYQATALKLQQEKHLRLSELEMARTRFQNGGPPVAEAEKEFLRMERLAAEKEEALRQKLEDERRSLPHSLVRTTAEPRPDAYVEEFLGVPKPYGNFAPFKPTDTGSNMRHIRKPVPVEIEL